MKSSEKPTKNGLKTWLFIAFHGFSWLKERAPDTSTSSNSDWLAPQGPRKYETLETS